MLGKKTCMRLTKNSFPTFATITVLLCRCAATIAICSRRRRTCRDASLDYFAPGCSEETLAAFLRAFRIVIVYKRLWLREP
jgi:hypothetical protein